MSTSSAYTLKKNETLEQVAKAHKLKVDEIWSFGPNNKLVAKRHSPDKCEPGDAVELPPSKADKAAALAKLEGVLDGLKQRATYIAAAEKRLEGLKADLDSKHKEWVAGLDKLSKGVKSDGDKADIAAMFIGFAGAAKTVVGSTREVQKLVAMEVKDGKVYARITELEHTIRTTGSEYILHPASSPGYSAAATVLSEGSSSDNAFLSAIGTAADWFGQLTSPSGWAKFITGVDKDLAKAREQIDENYVKMKAQIVRKQDALHTELKSVENMRNVLTPAYQNMKKG